MGTVIRPELSKKNTYWIERHRYYELKHFCMQYGIWKRERASLDGYFDLTVRPRVRTSGENDPVSEVAERREFYTNRIEMVERCARDTDGLIGPYILCGVTEGLTYDKLRARHGCPCCKDIYYDLYRRFFWLLDKTRK